MRAVLDACGLLILVSAALVAQMAWASDFDPDPGSKLPMLRLELASSADEARSVFRDPLGYGNRNVFRKLVELDGPFIACYTALLAGLGLIAVFRPGVGWKLLAAAVAGLAIAAAMFDVRENLAILALIETPFHLLTDGQARAVRSAALAKWGCFFGAVGLLSATFLTVKSTRRRALFAARAAGVLFMAAAGLGVVGLMLPTALAWALLAVSLGFLATLAMIAAWPDALDGAPGLRVAG